MSRKLSTASGDRGRPLAEFLAERLGLAGDEAVALVRRGGVYVDRRREEDPARCLGDRHKITVHTDPSPGTDTRSEKSSPLQFSVNENANARSAGAVTTSTSTSTSTSASASTITA
ncbi:MAG TPA: hypothetical protein VMZ28_26545, partial [Kofleriaceae bacterium]|nr:hypothetical protein [Kofleriaceae bacterium]